MFLKNNKIFDDDFYLQGARLGYIHWIHKTQNCLQTGCSVEVGS